MANSAYPARGVILGRTDHQRPSPRIHLQLGAKRRLAARPGADLEPVDA
jgi:hypothetical protein